ncbi:MAG: ATP-binding protein [Mycobacterium sp.]|uniref:ATP-binding protein n=1 Tax=Mycobacterium sp. TaxID=1785 RepID=UPI00389AE94C
MTSPGDRGCVVLFDEALRPASGLLTFLFTDIEGSTRRWEADAIAMRAALDAHDEVLRRAVEQHGGDLFNHTGDGVCAAFPSPRSAVDAAVEAQRQLELPVRMGIVTGEAETRGTDYSGTVLNRAARVMAAGHGGQVLIDGATAGLLSGVDLVGLGLRKLRDIAKPVELFQVRANGLRGDFPPLRTIDPTPGNLRPPTTSLVGREPDLAELETALKVHRLVTLTGVGGVGKTRLALELAARSAFAFQDGVFVIELAPVGDPGAVPEAVAIALGITQQPGLSVSDSVAAALDGRSRLLVFDNCEHVLDAAASLIESILNASTTVRVLATSREGLRVSDEQLWPVPSLDVYSSAATLFVERATAVVPAVLLAESDEAVIDVCRRVDGIPLAIELAASRMQSMSVTELRDRLDDRFRLLVGSRRGLERHQTLRHAVQWSYDLLGEAEKHLLTRCSVFAGGFDLFGACAVSGSDDEFATLDLLDSLVRKSLLVADSSSGQTRFSMLETIRQFAEEQLVQTGEADGVRNAHARYFAGRERDVLALWDGPRQREAYEWLTVELANLRGAFRWATDNDDLDTAVAVANFAALLGIWVEQYEPVGWAEELIDRARAVDHRRLPQLYVTAAMCYATGRVGDSLRYATAGRLAIESGRFDEVPYEFEVALSATYATVGDPDQWVMLCRGIIARTPGTHTLAKAFLVMGLTFAGASDEAMAMLESLLSAAEATDNPAVIGYAFLARGLAYRYVDGVAAYDAHRRGLTIAQNSGNVLIESHLAGTLAQLAAAHGEPTDAFDYLTVAIHHFYDAGSFLHLHVPLAILAAVFDRIGHPEPAAIMSAFSTTPLTRSSIPEIDTTISHLREVLGDEVYESLARIGETMTSAEMAAFALEQINQARAQLSHTNESQ